MCSTEAKNPVNATLNPDFENFEKDEVKVFADIMLNRKLMVLDDTEEDDVENNIGVQEARAAFFARETRYDDDGKEIEKLLDFSPPLIHICTRDSNDKDRSAVMKNAKLTLTPGAATIWDNAFGYEKKKACAKAVAERIVDYNEILDCQEPWTFMITGRPFGFIAFLCKYLPRGVWFHVAAYTGTYNFRINANGKLEMERQLSGLPIQQKSVSTLGRAKYGVDTEESFNPEITLHLAPFVVSFYDFARTLFCDKPELLSSTSLLELKDRESAEAVIPLTVRQIHGTNNFESCTLRGLLEKVARSGPRSLWEAAGAEEACSYLEDIYDQAAATGEYEPWWNTIKSIYSNQEVLNGNRQLLELFCKENRRGFKGKIAIEELKFGPGSNFPKADCVIALATLMAVGTENVAYQPEKLRVTTSPDGWMYHKKHGYTEVSGRVHPDLEPLHANFPKRCVFKQVTIRPHVPIEEMQPLFRELSQRAMAKIAEIEANHDDPASDI